MKKKAALIVCGILAASFAASAISDHTMAGVADAAENSGSRTVAAKSAAPEKSQSGSSAQDEADAADSSAQVTEKVDAPAAADRGASEEAAQTAESAAEAASTEAAAEETTESSEETSEEETSEAASTGSAAEETAEEAGTGSSAEEEEAAEGTDDTKEADAEASEAASTGSAAEEGSTEETRSSRRTTRSGAAAGASASTDESDGEETDAEAADTAESDADADTADSEDDQENADEDADAAGALSDYLTVTFPSDWEGEYETEEDSRDGIPSISVYEKTAYDNEEGGLLFRIGLYTQRRNYISLPEYSYLGTLKTKGGTTYAVVAEFPSDVQFSANTAEQYQQLSEEVPSILTSLQAAEGGTYHAGKTHAEKKAEDTYAFATILDQFRTSGMLPNGTIIDNADASAETNQYAILDIDGDGADELVMKIGSKASSDKISRAQENTVAEESAQEDEAQTEEAADTDGEAADTAEQASAGDSAESAETEDAAETASDTAEEAEDTTGEASEGAASEEANAEETDTASGENATDDAENPETAASDEAGEDAEEGDTLEENADASVLFNSRNAAQEEAGEEDSQEETGEADARGSDSDIDSDEAADTTEQTGDTQQDSSDVSDTDETAESTDATEDTDETGQTSGTAQDDAEDDSAEGGESFHKKRGTVTNMADDYDSITQSNYYIFRGDSEDSHASHLTADGITEELQNSGLPYTQTAYDISWVNIGQSQVNKLYNSVYIPVGESEEHLEALRNHAYKEAVKEIIDNNTLPDGTSAVPYSDVVEEDMAENSFAITDVDADGYEELLIRISNADADNARELVYGYDIDTKELVLEFEGVPEGITYYDNGTIQADARYDNNEPSVLWPFQLQAYNEETGSYEYQGSVYAWDSSLMTSRQGKTVSALTQIFPEDVDVNGDGRIYYLDEPGDSSENSSEESAESDTEEAAGSEAEAAETDVQDDTEENSTPAPVDDAAIIAWYNRIVTAGSEPVDIVWNALTEDNINVY